MNAKDLSPTQGRVEVNGVELFYRTYGTGEPLILLHGFFATGQLWEDYVSKFADSYQVIVPDLRGHGRSTNPTGKFTHQESAADIFGLLEGLGLETVRAIGFSSGAMTLLHMATHEPDRFESLILIGATSYFPKSARSIQRTFSFESMPPDIQSLLKQWHPRGDGQIEMLFQQFNETADSYDDMNFTPPYLSKITAPTLIIHGDRDEHFPVEIAVEMYRAIPKGYLWVAPKGRHDVIFDVWAESSPVSGGFANVALDFLDEGWADK